jgi:hypothetical protein
MKYCGVYGIDCPYALSDDAPIPCVGSQEECDQYINSLKEII